MNQKIERTKIGKRRRKVKNIGSNYMFVDKDSQANKKPKNADQTAFFYFMYLTSPNPLLDKEGEYN